MNRALGWMALCSLIAAAGCGGDGAGNASCRGTLNRYQECDVFAGGNQNCHALPERKIDDCLSACVEDASCDEIALYACENIPNSCLNDCLLTEEYSCDDGQKIQALLQCDDFADCDDGSDESRCKPTKWRCLEFGDEDIAGELVCDGETDCSNGSDEEDCGEFICLDFTAEAGVSSFELPGRDPAVTLPFTAGAAE